MVLTSDKILETDKLSGADWRCECSSLTVSALCQAEPVLLAPDLQALKDSAEQKNGCSFCLLCWTAMVNRFGRRTCDQWSQQSLEARGKDISTLKSKHAWMRGITVAADLKFLSPVRTSEGHLLEGREKLRLPKAPQIPISPSTDSVIGIQAPDGWLEGPTLRVFARAESEGASHIRELCSTADSDPDLKACQTLINRWLDECLSNHELCSSISSDDVVMPTRIIDCTLGKVPRLIATEGKQGKFIALSYCWGPQGKDLFVLNHDTESALLSGSVEEKVFAQTHRDAFHIARLLGIQYVWIDALCIIQGDRDDWARESKDMGRVYHNAFLTVVAGSSADSRDGFLRDRSPSQGIQPFPLPLDDSSRQSAFIYATLARSHTEGPTRTRGWCFQEAMLSQRMVIFGTEQLTFRCPSATYFEHTLASGLQGTASSIESKMTPVFAPDLLQMTHHAVLEHWYVMLREFTQRHLSNPHDVFASLAALAQTAGRHLGGSRYLAGLWETDLVRGLLWRPSCFGSGQSGGNGDGAPAVLVRPESSALFTPGESGPVVRAPSWSWAAVEGSIDHLDYEPDIGVPGMEAPERKVLGGERIKDSVFATGADFVRIRPVGADGWSWHNDDQDATHCGPDVLHMPACELRMWARVAKASITGEKVDVRKWKPREDWRPPAQRPNVGGLYNGYKFVFERALSIYSYGFHLSDGENKDKNVAVGLFDVQQEICEEVWCLQLTEIEGLMVKEVECSKDGGARRFQRLGLFWLEDQHWFEHLPTIQLGLV